MPAADLKGLSEQKQIGHYRAFKNNPEPRHEEKRVARKIQTFFKGFVVVVVVA